MSAELQAKVLRRITAGPCRFREIAGFCGGSSHFRWIDRALQSLRRAGKIEYVRGQWCLAAPPTKEEQ